MEDEEGELFDNTYLDELKRGSNREAGRESITLDEIRRRNSMVPPHLRSSYMPQYSADEAKVVIFVLFPLDFGFLKLFSATFELKKNYFIFFLLKIWNI